MPLYDYRCPECGVEFDVLCSIAGRNKPKLCECGERADRVLSGGNFMLIGGGWTGNAHPIIVPAKTDPNARTTPHENYYNCTPESVREAMNKSS